MNMEGFSRRGKKIGKGVGWGGVRSSKLREKERGLSVRTEGLGSTQPHCSELVRAEMKPASVEGARRCGEE